MIITYGNNGGFRYDIELFYYRKNTRRDCMKFNKYVAVFYGNSLIMFLNYDFPFCLIEIGSIFLLRKPFLNFDTIHLFSHGSLNIFYKVIQTKFYDYFPFHLRLL